MPRARFIRPEFFDDEKVGAVGFGARLLFQSLWVFSDLRGVCEWNAAQFRKRAFGFDAGVSPNDVQLWFDSLKEQGMVALFQANGKTWAFLPNFTDHQSFTTSEIKAGSRNPRPPDERPVGQPPADAVDDAAGNRAFASATPRATGDDPGSDRSQTVRPESDAGRTRVRRESSSPTGSPTGSPTAGESEARAHDSRHGPEPEPPDPPRRTGEVRYVQGQPWYVLLKRAGAKITAKNWEEWRAILHLDCQPGQDPESLPAGRFWPFLIVGIIDRVSDKWPEKIHREAMATYRPPGERHRIPRPNEHEAGMGIRHCQGYQA